MRQLEKGYEGRAIFFIPSAPFSHSAARRESRQPMLKSSDEILCRISPIGADILLKMTTSDSELIQQFARDRSEKVFATLVSRHVDLVYSAALRQVRSPQLAEDVAQTVFIDLARNADKLAPDTILTGWLYRVTRRAAIDVVRSESRRQLREQIAMELAAMNSPDPHWKEIEPLLDEAMDTLDEADRTSILLRYFENKTLREVGQTLGTSDDAVQKRVSRAVEKLRDHFSKKGIAIGSGGIAALLSANAVQSAPIALSATISSALIGATIKTTGTIAAAKISIMTTAQKSLVALLLVAASGFGIYEAREASTLRTKVQSLEQKQFTPESQIQQLTRERDQAKKQLADSQNEIERLKRNVAELVRLRDEVGRLRTDLANVKSSSEANLNNPMQAAMKSWVERAKTLQAQVKEVPEVCIPEFELLKDVDWLDAVKEFDLNEDFQGSNLWIHYAAAQLREAAKGHFAMQLAQALDRYLKANNDELPTGLTELRSYFESPINDEIIDRYKLIQQGKYSEQREELVTEKSRIANDNTRIEIGRRGYSHANWETSKPPGK